ncbi:Cytochrome c oxidase cbb3-type, subunit III [gamma proteobacterium HdN1]|nr:Cytochrome c oxidase cbb3-type, subunit III [gamma proteobacterium HdN1]
MSNFWSGWIITIVLINLLGCLWLLWWNREQDGDTSVGKSMGHSFDGIEEINNPMPKWWLNLFYGTIIFSFIYLALYPGMGSFKGLLGWTSDGQWQLEVDKADQRYGAIFAEYAKVPVADLAKDAEAVAVGKRLFGNNCAVCHGSDARGSNGFPNLTDGDWIFGGSPENIIETITKGRTSIGMPAFTAAPYQLEDASITDLTAYLLTLSNRKANAGDAGKGGQLFAEKGCAACHGGDATGMQMMGAPNLTDNVWLYGGSEQAIHTTIAHGRKGVMPAFEGTLGSAKIHVIASYILSLSQ